MRKRWFWIAPLAIVAIPLFLFVGGEVVMHLWNWLLPVLFGWPLITFWQALGLLLLCRILFGRLGGHGRGGDRSHGGCQRSNRWDRLWMRMTPEEREKFFQDVRAGRYGPEAPVVVAKETA